MTDNEIIKALECCVSEQYTCGQCPYQEIKHYDSDNGFEIMPNGKQYDDWSCERWLNTDLLDLINRQKAEIERLQEEIGSLNKKYPCTVDVGNNCLVYARSLDDYDNLIGDMSAEAVKEFADRLKEKAETEVFEDYLP